MKPRETITIPYTVGEHFLFYICYGDSEQLSSVEVEQFNEMENEARETGAPNYKFAHWSVTEQREEFATCEATQCKGACIKIQAVYFRNN
jgi:hypothetical protein